MTLHIKTPPLNATEVAHWWSMLEAEDQAELAESMRRRRLTYCVANRLDQAGVAA